MMSSARSGGSASCCSQPLPARSRMWAKYVAWPANERYQPCGTPPPELRALGVEVDALNGALPASPCLARLKGPTREGQGNRRLVTALVVV
jgi:hypothetical protein